MEQKNEKNQFYLNLVISKEVNDFLKKRARLDGRSKRQEAVFLLKTMMKESERE